jgi:hypothetical protein
MIFEDFDLVFGLCEIDYAESWWFPFERMGCQVTSELTPFFQESKITGLKPFDARTVTAILKLPANGIDCEVDIFSYSEQSRLIRIAGASSHVLRSFVASAVQPLAELSLTTLDLLSLSVRFPLVPWDNSLGLLHSLCSIKNMASHALSGELSIGPDTELIPFEVGLYSASRSNNCGIWLGPSSRSSGVCKKSQKLDTWRDVVYPHLIESGGNSFQLND